MKLVVDTNIVFSALIHQGNSMAEILLNPKNTFRFYAPSLLASELKRHEQKLAKLSSLPVRVLEEATEIILRRISPVFELKNEVVSPLYRSNIVYLSCNSK